MLGHLLRLRQVGALNDDVGAMFAGARDLGERRAQRNHDGRPDAEPSGVVSDALRMVAGRHGADARRALLRPQAEKLAQRAALLEACSELEILELEMKLAAADSRQKSGSAGTVFP